MRRGFTMVEALVAVMILGLVVTASLKLVAMSQRSLSQVREKEQLLNVVSEVQVLLTQDPTNRFGISGDLEWNVEEKKEPLWRDDAIDLDALAIGGENEALAQTMQQLKGQDLRWRELEVIKDSKSMTLFLPYSEAAARAASEDEDPANAAAEDETESENE